MKITFRSLILASLLVVTACGKDDSSDTAEQIEIETEQLEQTPLEADEVSDNLLITGGTKKDGIPPSPNGALSFDITGTSKMALLSEGFNISLNTDTQIAGAYLLIKASDGIMADSYYDINIDANTADNKTPKKIKKKISYGTTKNEGDISLDVDFTNEIEPGTFCYEVCVYDNDGNISEPQEVCVTVESWGGNADIIGAWSLLKEVETYQGNSATIVPGQEDCVPESLHDCDQGGQFSASYICYTTGSFDLVFNVDGTYVANSKDTEKQLKVEDSKAACEATFEELAAEYESKGNWAYNKSEKHLVMVEYEFTENYNGETETRTYDQGDAEVLFDGTIVLENSLLIIKVVDGPDDSYETHFEK